MKIPTDASPSVQQALREVWAVLTRLDGSKDIDMHGRKFSNAGRAVDGFEYITRQQAKNLTSGVTVEQQITQVTGGGSSAHQLLSSTHVDTQASGATRGDVLVVNSTGLWSRLAIGTSGKVLRSDGTDAAWTALSLGDLPSVPAVRASHNADQTINDATDTTLAFNGEDFDTDTMHDNATNNSRITFTTAGKYVVGWCLFWDGPGSPGAEYYRQVSVVQGGSTTVAVQRDASSQSVGGETIQAGSALLSFSATNYVELVVHQTSGSSIAVANKASYSPRFWAYRIGA